MSVNCINPYLFSGASNPWSYTMGANAGNSEVMFPNTMSSSMNDSMVMGYDGGAANMLNGSSNLLKTFMEWVDKYKAQQAETFQKLMGGIQKGGTTTTVDGVDSAASANGTIDLKEGQIIHELEKMGTGKSTRDRMAKEIDGETVLRKLITLTKDYLENPDDCKLNEDNFNIIWGVAGRYANDGELSTADYKQLLAIIKDPGKSQKSAEEDDGEEELGEVRPNAEQRTPETMTAIVDNFIGGIEGAGTNKSLIATALDPENGVRKGNVLEVMESYRKKIRQYPNEKQDLISGILGDLGGWGHGDTTWYAFLGMGNDDAKPRLDAIREALTERAQAFIKENGEEKGITKDDINAFVLPEKRNDANIKALFDTFTNKLKEAEGKIYKDEN